MKEKIAQMAVTIEQQQKDLNECGNNLKAVVLYCEFEHMQKCEKRIIDV